MTDTNGGTLAPLDQVDEAVKTLAWYRRVELVLVVVATAAALVAVGFSAWTASQVRSCTVPEGRCYRDNTVRARQTTRQFLEKLDRDHEEIECLLLVPPLERTEADVVACETAHTPKEPPP